jgi:hypothetical protein
MKKWAGAPCDILMIKAKKFKVKDFLKAFLC